MLHHRLKPLGGMSNRECCEPRLKHRESTRVYRHWLTHKTVGSLHITCMFCSVTSKMRFALI